MTPMDRYAVFRVGSTFYRLHGLYADDRRAAEAYNSLVARMEAVLVRVRDGAVTVLAAGGLSAEGVARDTIFLDAVRAAVG
jgi:hypothetical protein